MTKKNLWIFTFYILLTLVFPAEFIFANLFARDAYVWSYNWNRAVRIIMFFGTFPVYFIYTFLILRRHFPKKTIKALSLFLPYLLSFIIYFFWVDLSLLDFFVLNSLPFFLGINLLYFIGLLVLIVQKTRREPINKIIIKVIGTIIIAGIIFIPVLHSFIIGIKLNLEKGGLVFLFGFLAIVISTAVSHFPILKELYEERKL